MGLAHAGRAVKQYRRQCTRPLEYHLGRLARGVIAAARHEAFQTRRRCLRRGGQRGLADPARGGGQRGGILRARRVGRRAARPLLSGRLHPKDDLGADSQGFGAGQFQRLPEIGTEPVLEKRCRRADDQPRAVDLQAGPRAEPEVVARPTDLLDEGTPQDRHDFRIALCHFLPSPAHTLPAPRSGGPDCQWPPRGGRRSWEEKARSSTARGRLGPCLCHPMRLDCSRASTPVKPPPSCLGKPALAHCPASRKTPEKRGLTRIASRVGLPTRYHTGRGKRVESRRAFPRPAAIHDKAK